MAFCLATLHKANVKLYNLKQADMNNAGDQAGIGAWNIDGHIKYSVNFSNLRELGTWSSRVVLN